VNKTGKKKPPVTRPVAEYAFRLYVTGATPRSARAIQNLINLCEKHLPGKYEVEVVDLFQQPGLARRHQVIAAPTLVKHFPLPLRRFIGDLSDGERIMVEIAKS
jgi:circadian clock protein KaiB